MHHTIISAAAGKIDFAGSWEKFWNQISSQIGGITTLMGIFGMLLVVAGIIGFLFERRRSGGMGGGNKTQALVWAIVIGAILAAPDFVLPVLLAIFDYAANGIVAMLGLGK